MTSNLELIIGPMFSGKSTEIIKRANLLIKNNNKILIIKPILDNRYNENKITSHNLECIDCRTISKLNDITDDEINSIDTLIIDEGQFFDDLFQMVTKWLNNNSINIIIAGLDGDFKQNPIGQILNLIPLSDECIKLKSVCNRCNNKTPAPFTHRINSSNSIILIGGSESYIPVCRKHYNELNETLHINK